MASSAGGQGVSLFALADGGGDGLAAQRSQKWYSHDRLRQPDAVWWWDCEICPFWVLRWGHSGACLPEEP